ncbi:hypothetical protein CWE09_05710 [Aliidiomarina minuta]|uniref:RCC1-like domain-containing protein n=1 Tax=Aliidiomarina minuta TaxID=880057 RepID=A0A432W7Y2_9GAMM|nr:CFI-box-CTERM domain-containing protein [Aliidiomarina minuta]RUO26210.1 hypothetical protein CWE09_05710 [Aliidiomarina minuta]
MSTAVVSLTQSLLVLAWLCVAFFSAPALAAETNNGQSISGGEGFSLLLKKDATLWSLGSNNSGRLGLGGSTYNNVDQLTQITGLSGVQAISSGRNFSHALLKNGDVYAWGSNNDDQLGDGSSANQSTPVPIVMPDKRPVVAMAHGEFFALLLDDEGQVRSAGRDQQGQLGNGGGWSRVPMPAASAAGVKIAAGAEHALLLDAEGQLWAWGNNRYGQLGNGDEGYGVAESFPVAVLKPDDVEWVQIAAGPVNSYALDSEGYVWSWGREVPALGRDAAVTGDGEVPARIDPADLSQVNYLQAGGQNHAGRGLAFARTENGEVFAWGYNNNGQLGIGSTQDQSSPRQVQFAPETEVKQLSVGHSAAYAATEDGAFYAWGANSRSNYLAANDSNSKTIPIQMHDKGSAAMYFSADFLAAERPYYLINGLQGKGWLIEKNALRAPELTAEETASWSLSGRFLAGAELALSLLYGTDNGTDKGQLRILLNEQTVWTSEQLDVSDNLQSVVIDIPLYDGITDIEVEWQALQDTHEPVNVLIQQLSLPSGELSLRPLVSLPQQENNYFDAIQITASVETLDGNADAWFEYRIAEDADWQRITGSQQEIRSGSGDLSAFYAVLACSSEVDIRAVAESQNSDERTVTPVQTMGTSSCDGGFLRAPAQPGSSSLRAHLREDAFYYAEPEFSARKSADGGASWQPAVVVVEHNQDSLAVSGLSCESAYQLEINASWEAEGTLSTASQQLAPIETAACQIGFDISGGTSIDMDEDQCFIATAAFGSLLEPQVSTLRQFRDRFLRGHRAGDAFIAFYYEHSPALAQRVATHEWLAAVVRLLLLPVIAAAWLLLNAPWLLLAGVLFLGLGWAAKRYILTVLLAVGLSACSSTPEQTDMQAYEYETQQRQLAPRSGYVQGHGAGSSREEALQNAQFEIAEQVLSNVRGEDEQRFRQSGDELEEEFTSTLFTWSNVELENVRVAHSQRFDDSWYVRAEIDNETMQRITAQARRNAASLNKVLQLEQVAESEPARRQRRALEGLALAARDGVGDATFTTADGQSATFANYFRGAVESSVDAMKVLPIVANDGERVRFVLLHQETARPQPNTVLRISTEELSTDANGFTAWVELSDLPANFNIFIVGYATQSIAQDWRHPELALMHTDSVTRQRLFSNEQATVYIYKNPQQANIEIDGRSVGSPVRHSVDTGATYRVSANMQGHRSLHSDVDIAAGAPYGFAYFALEERQYGWLALSARDRRSTLQVNRNGNSVYKSVSNNVNRELEAGAYHIEVGRLDGDEFDPDYQIIDDRFQLITDRTVNREYTAPAYRHPYHHGWRFSFYHMRAGGEPTDDYKLPWVQGRNINYSDLTQIERVNHVNYEGPESEFEISVQRYLNRFNLTTQFSGGTRSHQLLLEREDRNRDVGLELDNYFVSAGIGFWFSFLEDSVVTSLTINHGLEYAQWSDDSRAEVQPEQGAAWERLPSDGVANSYSFAELNTHFSLGGGVGLTLSVVTPIEGVEPSVRLGLGYAFMSSGYRLEPRVNAQEGRHYR